MKLSELKKVITECLHEVLAEEKTLDEACNKKLKEEEELPEKALTEDIKLAKPTEETTEETKNEEVEEVKGEETAEDEQESDEAKEEEPVVAVAYRVYVIDPETEAASIAYESEAEYPSHEEAYAAAREWAAEQDDVDANYAFVTIEAGTEDREDEDHEDEEETEDTTKDFKDVDTDEEYDDVYESLSKLYN